jgi:DNA-binding LytR/AlgR family response regulator
LKSLIEQLDPAQFQQIHRSVVVNLSAVSHVARSENETADLHFRDRTDVLPVSRTYLHLFKAE